jgi:hypothetical protein
MQQQDKKEIKWKMKKLILRKKQRIIAKGLTLEKARAHCSKESTHSKSTWIKCRWFDGYTKEN